MRRSAAVTWTARPRSSPTWRELNGWCCAIDTKDEIRTEVMDWAAASPEERTRLIASAADLLRRGGLVAYPTETVYGLGACGFDREAVSRVFAVKERPADRPLLLALTGPEMLDGVVREVPDLARALMDAFWPGPLSLILPRSDRVPDAVTAGGDGVGVRCPDHPAARQLIRELGAPLTSPSANISGQPSCRCAGEVLEHLGGRIEAVIDGGPVGGGAESTVVDLTGEVPVLVRRGALGPAQLREHLPALAADGSLVVVCTGNTCRSPVAAAIMSDRLGVRVESAGVRAHPGSPATEEAVIAAGEAGYDLEGHRARGLDDVQWSAVDLVVTMTARQAAEVSSHLEAVGERAEVFTLGELAGGGDVEDPIGGPLSRYQEMVKRLEQMVESGRNEILRHL
ncbi:MAG: L-threonylcarbamoyladenylate synthase [Bacillota bacterium]